MKSVTNINLRKLGKALMSMHLYEEAWMVHDLIKTANTKGLVIEMFLERFLSDDEKNTKILLDTLKGKEKVEFEKNNAEDINKIRKIASIALAFFNKFQDSTLINEESLRNFLIGNNSLGEVINFLKGKAKEEKVTGETALERFRKSETIPEELIKLLGVEQEEELLELEESDVSKQHYPWAISILMNDEEDPMFEIISAIKIWDRNKEELAPLEEYRSLSELRGSIDGLGTASKSAYLYSIKNHANDPANTDIIYNSDNFTVVLCGTTMSSQWWADGTVWCTSYLEGNMFEHYSGDGIYLYYLISKNDKAIKRYDKMYNDPQSASRYTRWSYGGRNAQNLKKISIGYVKRDGKPILLTDQNATVDKANHNISKEDIENYLGDEAGPVFDAIEKDLDGRGETKFEQIKRNTTPETLAQQIDILTRQDMEHQAENLVRYFVRQTDEGVNRDTVEYAAQWLFNRDSNYWSYEEDYDRQDYLYLSEDKVDAFSDIREKYKKMEAERLIEEGKFGQYFRSALSRDYPEYSYRLLERAEYGTTGQAEDEANRGGSWLGDWRSRPLSITEFLDLAGDPEYYTEDEFSEIRANIKRNFEKAISLGDKNILYLNYLPFHKDSHVESLAKLYPGGIEEVYKVMRPAVESAAINYDPASYFSMEWYKVYPDLEPEVIDSLIAIQPNAILQIDYIKEKYPNLIPVGIWGTTISEIISLDLYKKYKPMIRKLFEQINKGNRIPNHPLLFTISNKDRMRTEDLRDLASSRYYLDIFKSIVRGSSSDHGEHQDWVDERLHGMNLDYMLPERTTPDGISEDLRDAIDKEEDRMYYNSDSGYYEDMPPPDVLAELPEDELPEDIEYAEKKEERSGDFTWGANIPELQKLVEDNNNREARASRLKSLYKFARLCAA